MTHDPLCPAMNCIDSGCGDCCRCGLIAKVRDGERDSVAAVRLRTVFWEQGYRDGQRDMLAKCIDWMLDPHHHPSEEAAAWAYAFVEALRDLKEQP